MSVVAANPLVAQQKGQYIPGQSGLNAGILPDPGVSYINMTMNYSADTLKDANGNPIPLTGTYDIWASENIFYYIPHFKLFGAKPGAMIVVTPANGSLVLGSLNFPNVVVGGGGGGLADLWVQPVTLGWSLKRADVNVYYAFVAPSGRYSPGASDNIGSGYWGNNLGTGTTVYLTKNKATTANLFTNWEIHGSRQTGNGTTLTPGQAFTMEWGFGQILPLKKDLSMLLQPGLIGYDQWQVTDNGGLLGPNVPASAVPHYAVHAVGFQANYLLPAKALNFFFKYENEYSATSRPQGHTIVFGGSFTFRIPKSKPVP